MKQNKENEQELKTQRDTKRKPNPSGTEQNGTDQDGGRKGRDAGREGRPRKGRGEDGRDRTVQGASAFGVPEIKLSVFGVFENCVKLLLRWFMCSGGRADFKDITIASLSKHSNSRI